MASFLAPLLMSPPPLLMSPPPLRPALRSRFVQASLRPRSLPWSRWPLRASRGIVHCNEGSLLVCFGTCLTPHPIIFDKTREDFRVSPAESCWLVQLAPTGLTCTARFPSAVLSAQMLNASALSARTVLIGPAHAQDEACDFESASTAANCGAGSKCFGVATDATFDASNATACDYLIALMSCAPPCGRSISAGAMCSHWRAMKSCCRRDRQSAPPFRVCNSSKWARVEQTTLCLGQCTIAKIMTSKQNSSLPELPSRRCRPRGRRPTPTAHCKQRRHTAQPTQREVKRSKRVQRGHRG